ncbi:MAG TPA: helix-turn-helix transcriptional regulator [Stellaceae bacterium]|nr:helix-turn-helix transcriptional regulator [Stellaceae bacterium]
MESAEQTLPVRDQGRRPRHRRSELDIYAGERLRLARQLAGCSQQQLGEALGVSFQAVQKYEIGENRLSAGKLVKAAAFLGVDLVFFAKDPAASGALAQSTGFTTEEMELVRAYRALRSPALKAQLRRLITSLAALVPEAEAGER